MNLNSSYKHVNNNTSLYIIPIHRYLSANKSLSMNKNILVLVLFSFGSHAQLNIIRALFMADEPSYTNRHK